MDANRLVADERAGANLRPAQILQNCHLPSGTLCRQPDASERCHVRLVGPVRKIEPDDVGPRRNQRIKYLVGITRRPDGGYDFRVAHTCRWPMAAG